ncbi:MAG: hypothetical protein EBZ78_11185 [Verrucomicrobia bacterium]|nr:hypothetical protein [Verrucomicrobiota bacterium]
MNYYYSPSVNQSDDIMRPHNPMQPEIRFVSDAIALGPTRVMNDPSAGYVAYERTGLDGVSDALDVFTAVNFLFPA